MNRIKMADVHILLDLVNTVQITTGRKVAFIFSDLYDKRMISIYAWADEEREIVFLKSFFIYPHGDEDDVTSYRECKQYLNQLLED